MNLTVNYVQDVWQPYNQTAFTNWLIKLYEYEQNKNNRS